MRVRVEAGMATRAHACALGRWSSTILAVVLGCRSDVDTVESGSSTTGRATHASTSTGDSSTTTSSGPTSSGADSTTGIDECVKLIEGGPFELVTDESLGMTSVADVDFDGNLDVVGARGVVVFADLSVLITADPPDASGTIGEFTGDGVLDLVYSTSAPDGLVVVPSIVDGGDAPIATPGEPALTFTVGDYDRDGIGDVAAGYPDGVEVWHGEGDGTFTSPGLFR